MLNQGNIPPTCLLENSFVAETGVFAFDSLGLVVVFEEEDYVDHHQHRVVVAAGVPG